QKITVVRKFFNFSDCQIRLFGFFVSLFLARSSVTLAPNDRPALSSFRGGAQRLRAGMRQRRQLGKRRANATMVSRPLGYRSFRQKYLSTVFKMIILD